MMLTIKCPKCTTEGKMSLVERDYEGPYKCWKCREYFTLTIRNNEVASCEPLSQEEYERQHPRKPTINMTIGDVRSGGDNRRGLF